jgi:cell division protein FtsL
MAQSRYEYGTSPRKLEPDIQRKRKTQKQKIKVVEDLPRQEIRISKEQKNRQIKLTLTVVAIFIALLTISYRNSQINEKFNQVQTLKKELSSLQKENEQLKVSIENSVNLNTIEKQAKEKLGMQKLTNKQTVYVSLPKKDYVESASEEVILEKEKNWFEQFVDKIFNR